MSDREKRKIEREELLARIENEEEEGGQVLRKSARIKRGVFRITKKRGVILNRRITSGGNFNEFWEHFNILELNKFKILTRYVCKQIWASLHDHGVSLRNEETHYIARSLYDCVKSDKNLCLDENNRTTSELEVEK
ncbi:hypothetical protein GcM1_179022 [Golovinomyces cichoracearum]|uniref:Uncharacterized protein n=1 Tax=Golovinomyces cichoracearum TaxID=62708 RepID=A0A420J4T1_9PEZI|nr:hypothetical protein GcM1_179022 [Golovinomyces cichoracearum]